MTLTVNITDFRQNLFGYVKLLAREGYEMDVEREGEPVLTVTRAKKRTNAKYRKLYELLKKYGGKFPDWKYSRAEFRDNMAEKGYWERIDNLWK